MFQAQTTGVLSGDNVDPLLRKVGVGLERTDRARDQGADPRRSTGGADAFACISRDIERETLACGVPRDRVWYLPNAIDMTHFRPAEPRRARSPAAGARPPA